MVVGLDKIFWFAGIVAEAAVLSLLLYRRVWKTLPFFCGYCAWILLSDAGNVAIGRYDPGGYTSTYLLELILDSALEFCVLVELTWSVLRPIRSSLPRRSLAVIALVVGLAGTAIWPFADLAGLSAYAAQMHFLVHLQQTAAMLRILLFLVLVACSHLLSLSWRDRELQVATGLGFYSLASLAVALMHSNQAFGPQYRTLEQVSVASYLCSLFYWVYSFAQAEAKRHAFTPGMQRLLLAVAGVAEQNRLDLAESVAKSAQKRNKNRSK